MLNFVVAHWIVFVIGVVSVYSFLTLALVKNRLARKTALKEHEHEREKYREHLLCQNSIRFTYGKRYCVVLADKNLQLRQKNLQELLIRQKYLGWRLGL